MGFSHGYGTVPEETYSIQAIRKARDFGCTFFDTAESYGQKMFFAGHNEQLVGKAVEPFRKEIVLATKFHLPEEQAPRGAVLEQEVRCHLEASMKNFHTNYVDLYYLHRGNELVPVEEIADVMGKIIKAGQIQGWEMSQVSADIIDRAHRVTPLASVQNLYNMMERDCEQAVFPYCMENGIGVVPFFPIASGFLSGEENHDCSECFAAIM